MCSSDLVDRYLSKEKAPYEFGQEVDVLIWQKTDLGFKAIIENQYSGLLYESEIFQRPSDGDDDLRADADDAQSVLQT